MTRTPGIRSATAAVAALVFLSVATSSKTLRVVPESMRQRPGPAAQGVFSTIDGAIRAAAAGDTISLSPGLYGEVITLNGRNGTEDGPLCIMGSSEKPEEYPIIDGGATEPSLQATTRWITVRNSSWIDFSKIRFRNGWTLPIQIDNSSYVTFAYCQFAGGKRVISVGGDSSHHILVEHCSWDQGGEKLWTVERDTAGVDAWTSMHHGNMAYYNGSLIDFSGTGGSMVVRYNTIVNAFNGIRYRGRPGHDSNVEIYGNTISFIRDNDVEPEYYTYNLHIYHNVSHNIHRTLSVDNVEGGNIYYYGNVVTTDTDPWSTKVCAGFWKIYSGPRKLSYPVYLFNNSLYGTGHAFATTRDRIIRVRHWNNAYYFTSGSGWALNRWDTTNAFDYDVSNMPWSLPLVENRQERHGKIADVRFVDPGNRNLMPAPGSPAVDAGTVVSLKEFNWTEAYTGKAPDAGAFEGGELVEGPPFRFMPPPEGQIVYRERPRIVRERIVGQDVFLYFSDRIDPSSVAMSDFLLFKGEMQLEVTDVSVPDSYCIQIAVRSIPPDGDLGLCLRNRPRGINGEQVTGWASTVRMRKATR